MGTQPARFLMTASIAYSGSISGADLLFWIFARSQANPYCASASGSSKLMLKAETWYRCLVRVLRRPFETATEVGHSDSGGQRHHQTKEDIPGSPPFSIVVIVWQSPELPEYFVQNNPSSENWLTLLLPMSVTHLTLTTGIQNSIFIFQAIPIDEDLS